VLEARRRLELADGRELTAATRDTAQASRRAKFGSGRFRKPSHTCLARGCIRLVGNPTVSTLKHRFIAIVFCAPITKKGSFI
jgi:hypothetical protein